MLDSDYLGYTMCFMMISFMNSGPLSNTGSKRFTINKLEDSIIKKSLLERIS